MSNVISLLLKSNGSHKSSSSRRSKVTFTELHPEIYVIPPKSPPKPKRSKGPTRSPVTADEEIDLIMAMRGDETDQSATGDAFVLEVGAHQAVGEADGVRGADGPACGGQVAGTGRSRRGHAAGARQLNGATTGGRT